MPPLLGCEDLAARIGKAMTQAGLRQRDLVIEITAQQVQAAKQSNPLILLPGKCEIDQYLFRQLALRVPFVLCHADIDHLKSFNDEYGYRQGDQVLQQDVLLKSLPCAKSRSKSVQGSAAALGTSEIAASCVGSLILTYDVRLTRELTLMLKALG